MNRDEWIASGSIGGANGDGIDTSTCFWPSDGIRQVLSRASTVSAVDELDKGCGCSGIIPGITGCLWLGNGVKDVASVAASGVVAMPCVGIHADTEVESLGAEDVVHPVERDCVDIWVELVHFLAWSDGDSCSGRRGSVVPSWATPGNFSIV